jgi:hypothetical protein
MTYTTFGPGDSATWGSCTDPRDPRWDGDFEPTQDMLADAEDEFLTDTCATSLWLVENLKQADGESTFTDGFWHLDMSNATVDQLWALILTGSNDQCLHARMELRDRMVKDQRDHIARLAVAAACNTNLEF